MKVPPKRKGNALVANASRFDTPALNESPSEKEGKCETYSRDNCEKGPLNESPSEKEGKSTSEMGGFVMTSYPSMKVPPKRKGNFRRSKNLANPQPLNESPSEKEGKSPRMAKFRAGQ